ncbi:hypothetical protein BKD74_07490 [Corynebacterium diphtheriae]|uniref:Uncharacterized protein n=1 Tax=Corynebacterium diphtheriae bv. mitis TaxID=1806053 RepID=A0A854NKL3_CORDP|nr:hypothetical protein VN94_08940 [Corynebacterium diphtheriae]MBG9257613.1 hypothetical protein [Corynebacterium diphtheriae bv. mitis]MBG9271049.1 hypothetical protein [Corynebacterium diphtheriae bv. gravis]MBG9292178.1 hypothetical protein [Corynebacterium diphtheriae bv. gravis]MBG9336213.1 hypothetical protein [Corynebacterium diphtheriae bv. gravis]
MGPVRVRTSHKIPGSLALSVQNQGPTVQPNRNAIGDTIYRTTEHGDSYRYRSRARRADQWIPRMRAANKALSKRRKDILAYIRHTINAL